MDTGPSVIPEWIASFVRTTMAALAGYFVGKGVIDQGMADQLGGIALAVATLGWSVWQKWDANKKLKSAIAAPAGKA